MHFHQPLADIQTQTPIPLAFKKYGEQGPHLVILHGLFGSGNNWGGFARKFKNRFQIWTLDARNHGNSPHSSFMNYEVMAEDVLFFLQENQLEKVILLGHSMGGKMAMTAALKKPDVIAGLIVADMAPVKYGHSASHAELIQTMQSVVFTPEKTREQVDAELAEKITTDHVRAFLLTNLKRKKGQLGWRIPLKEIAASIPNLMDSLKTEGQFCGPTLFVGGADSDYIVPEYHSAIKSYFPNSKIAKLKNCGHVLHEEQPEAFAQTMELFFQHLSKT